MQHVPSALATRICSVAACVNVWLAQYVDGLSYAVLREEEYLHISHALPPSFINGLVCQLICSLVHFPESAAHQGMVRCIFMALFSQHAAQNSLMQSPMQKEKKREAQITPFAKTTCNNCSMEHIWLIQDLNAVAAREHIPICTILCSFYSNLPFFLGSLV